MIPFSVIIGLGATFGLLRVLQNTPATTQIRWLLTALITLTGAMVGARVGFVIAYSSYFKTHGTEMFQIAQGGLSWPGAFIGAILFAWLGLALFKLPLLSGADRLSRMLLPLGLAIWLAGWQAGIAYGQPLPAGTWWGMLITDESGLTTLRVPVQAAAVLSLIFLLFIGERLINRSQHTGLKAGVLCSLFTLHALLFSLMRDDIVQKYLGFRLDTWAAAILFIISLLFLFLAIFRKDRIITPEVNEMEK